MVLIGGVLPPRGLVEEAAVAAVAAWVCRNVLVINLIAEDFQADGTLSVVLIGVVVLQRGLVEEAAITTITTWVCHNVLVINSIADGVLTDLVLPQRCLVDEPAVAKVAA